MNSACVSAVIRAMSVVRSRPESLRIERIDLGCGPEGVRVGLVSEPRLATKYANSPERQRGTWMASRGSVSSSHRSGGRAARGRMRGFTLIEIMVSFTILALGLGIAMQIATGAMRNARVAAERTEAALYAQSLLDGIGVGERLATGESRGEFNDDYDWQLTVDEYEVALDDAQNGIDAGMAPVQLYRLELVVSWGRDRRREQQAHFVTLRALTPDMGG